MCFLPPVLLACWGVGTGYMPACSSLHVLSTNKVHALYMCVPLCRTHNLLVLLGRTVGHERSAVARSAAQHCRWRWLVASLFVVSYSWLISMFLPYFSSLVGIVASSTYLVSAGTSCHVIAHFALDTTCKSQQQELLQWHGL